MNDHGFSLLEVFVSMFITLSIFFLIAMVFTFQSDTYIDDLSRVRIQQNLRSALDLIAINVRQAGEGLDGTFPALTLSQSPTTLTVRRKVLHDVLNLCQPVTIGDTQIMVSDHASTSSRCLPVDVATGVSNWASYRTTTSSNGSVSIYIFDRVAKVGEFVTYMGEGVTSDGDNFLNTRPTLNNYQTASTSLYGLEEYSFKLLDTSTPTIELIVDGDTTSPRDVAYKVTGFNVLLTFGDGTTAVSLQPTDTHSWKDLQKVRISLNGQETWKSQTFTRSVSGEYFPRNVPSH